MEWIALRHALLSHLPVATGLLLPWPLLAAQRRGRGIRPWWTVARYLGWAGLLGLLGSLVSGLASGAAMGPWRAHGLWPSLVSGLGPQGLVLRHALLAGLSLAIGVTANWAMNRPRQDHQSLGLLALALGLAWSTALLLTGQHGYSLAHRTAHPIVPPSPQGAEIPAARVVKPQPTRVEPDLEARLPVRALDYAALEPIQPDPVKSLAHGGRWIRAYASPEAAAAYRAGEPLPQGALVVLSSAEDRYGRPGPEVGPIYALEMKAAGPSLTCYWARVPKDRRGEFGGETRVYWHEGDAHLESCRVCHAEGMADPARRSRWRARRVTSTE